MGKLGPVVQSVISLTNALGCQLVKKITTLLPNTGTLIIFIEKIREAFAMQKLLIFFQLKKLVY